MWLRARARERGDEGEVEDRESITKKSNNYLGEILLISPNLYRITSVNHTRFASVHTEVHRLILSQLKVHQCELTLGDETDEPTTD